MTGLLAALCILASPGAGGEARAGGKKYVLFDPPGKNVPYGVSVSLQFVMGEVTSEDEIVVTDETCHVQVPTVVTDKSELFDGSIMGITLVFFPPSERHAYSVSWGGGGRRMRSSRSLDGIDVVPSVLRDEMPTRPGSYSVGRIRITVSKGGAASRYVYFVPIGIILVVLAATKVYLRNK